MTQTDVNVEETLEPLLANIVNPEKLTNLEANGMHASKEDDLIRFVNLRSITLNERDPNKVVLHPSSRMSSGTSSNVGGVAR